MIVGAKGKNSAAEQTITFVIHHPVKTHSDTAIGAITKTPIAKLKYIAPRK